MNRRTTPICLVLIALCSAAPPAIAQPCTPQWFATPPEQAPSWDVEVLMPWQPPGSSYEVLVAGGVFRFIGTTEVGLIAAWDGFGWSRFGNGFWGGSVRTLAVYPDPAAGPQLIAGGGLYGPNNSPPKGLARWDGTAWQEVGGGLTHSATGFGWPRLRTTAIFENQLFVTGSIEGAGGVPVHNWAKWNGSEWAAFTTEQNFAYDLHVFSGALYAAGSFSGYRPGPWAGVIKWNGQDWEPAGEDVPESFFALGEFQGRLIATGISGIARWDGNTWSALGAGISGTGRALTTFDYDGPGPAPEMLFVGGSFSSAGGQLANGFAAWDGASWHTFPPGLNHQVLALAPFQNQLYLGGRFTTAGGMPSPYLARWGCPSTPPPVCYANCDGSTVEPRLNIDDFNCFIIEFAAGWSLPHAQQIGHYANCDGSTIAPALNVDDFTCFINQFAAGCR